MVNKDIIVGLLKKQKKWMYKVAGNGTPECGYIYVWKNQYPDNCSSDHYLFRDQVKFSHISRGQSSTRAQLVSRNGGKYELSPTEIGFFIQVLTGLTEIPFTIDSEGYVDIHFVMAKQGSSVGIEVVNPKTIEYKEI
jgi:hypothetical protein